LPFACDGGGRLDAGVLIASPSEARFWRVARVIRAEGVTQMTEKQKAETLDLLMLKKVIEIRRGNRLIDGIDTDSTWIEQGETKELVLEGYVS